MEEWYYSRMDHSMQTAYRALYQGAMEQRSRIQIPALGPEQIQDVFFRMRLDHPEIFWMPEYRYQVYPDSPNIQFLPGYLFTGKKLTEQIQAMNARVTRLVRPVLKAGDEEKEKFIHDFICSSVRYDKLKKPASHEILGPLGQGVGVCEGIAKSVKVLCDALGLEGMIALCDSNPEKGIRYRHTWNILKIHGKFVHLDATFDATLSASAGLTRYDYYNLCDNAVFRDHEPLIAPAPPCTQQDLFYYRAQKLSFTKEQDVRNRALQAAKKGKCLVFHWRGGYLTREKLGELTRILGEAGAERGKTARIRLNWPQSVIQVDYLAPEIAGSVVMEDAGAEEQAAEE